MTRSGRSPASPATTPNLVLRPPYPAVRYIERHYGDSALSLTKLAGGITGDPTEEQIYDESFLDKAWETLEK